LATVLLFTGSATAQGQVWVVTGEPELRNAIAAAADGDAILLKGSWSTTSEILLKAKSLTLSVDRGSDVRLASATVRDIAADQRVELRGLTFVPAYDFLQLESPPLILANNQGSVWIEGCNVLGFESGEDSGPGVVIIRCSNVVLLSSSVKGNRPGDGSCSFPELQSGHGLVLRAGSRVVAHGCTFQGARGFVCSQTDDHPEPGAAGIRSEAPDDRLFLSGCQVVGGAGVKTAGVFLPNCSDGGPGLSSAGVARVHDTSLQGGPGAFSGSRQCSANGPDQVGNVRVLAGRALGFSASSPVSPTDVVQYEFRGPAGAPVWLLIGKDPESIFLRSLSGVFLVDSPRVKFMGVTDASGVLHFTSTPPPVPTGVEFNRTLLQAVYRVPPSPGGRFGPYVLGAASMLLAVN
jgi:hypothetical protein